MHLHGLTKSKPDTIYLNHEQAPRPQNTLLDQKRIDMAFRSHQRKSQNKINFGDINICTVNGMNTNQLGVISKTVTFENYPKAKVRMTNLERTLIDIAVRPAYSGGTDTVIEAYIAARDLVQASDLLDTLTNLRYVYPYHQAIGYYLENADYPSTQVDLFRQIPRNYDFYLTHQIKHPKHIKEWNIYVPDN